MTTPREFFTFASSGAFALLVGGACTQPVTAQIPISDGWGPGGGGPSGSGASSSSGSSSGSKPSSSGSGSGGVSSSGGSGGKGYDAGNPNAPDTGAGGYDAGGGAPDGGGIQNAGGCMNLHCATDTNECGCQATGANGQQVLLGCQAGGDCVCIVNGNADGQPFPEDGACADQQSTEAQFLSNCSCQ